jgi:hypothetical protein
MPQNIWKSDSRGEAAPSAPYGSEVSYFAWRRGFATQSGRDALQSSTLPPPNLRPMTGH